MAKVSDLMAKVRAAGANIEVDGGRLRLVNGRKLPAEALDYIKRYATQIAEWLDHEGEFEERAGIIEHDSGFDRNTAEGLARLLLAQPPAGANPADWSWFVGHAARIMDGSSDLRSAA